MGAQALWNACCDHYEGLEASVKKAHDSPKAYWATRLSITKIADLDNYIMGHVRDHVDDVLEVVDEKTGFDDVLADVKKRARNAIGI